MKSFLLSAFFLGSFCFFLTADCFGQKASSVPDSLFLYIKKAPQDKSYIRAVNQYAWWLIHSLDSPQKADSLLRSAEVVARKWQDWDGLQRIYLNRARAAMRSTGYHDALKYTQNAQELSKKHPATPAVKQLILSSMGQCYFYTNQMEIGLKYFLAATKLTEKYRLREGSARAYIGVSEILQATNRHKEAIAYAYKALKAGEMDTDKTAMVWSRLLISEVLAEQGQADLARKYLLNVLPDANRFSSITQKVGLWQMLAGSYIDASDFDSASIYLNMIRPNLNEKSNPGVKMSGYSILGKFYRQTGNMKRSEEYFKKGLQAAVETNYYFAQLSPLINLTQIYSHTNRYKQAYEYYVQLDEVKDSIYSNQLAAKTRDLISRYESQKKEDEIKLLVQQKKNDRLERNAMLAGIVLLLALIVVISAWLVNRAKVAQLKEAQRLRQQIANDLHDEVGSTLSSISLLSGVADQLLSQSKIATPQIGTFQPVENENGPAQKIVRKIYADTRQILESVDEIIWTIHPSDNSSVTIAQKLQDFAMPLMESKNIACTFSSNPLPDQRALPLEVRRNIYLIGKEAINNLVKHAHASQAHIDLTIRQKQISLTVEDNGIGFDPEESSTRNGMKSMQHRARAISATLNVHSKPGEGTRVSLLVPGY